MDLFLASKPDQVSPDGKEHVIRTLSRIRDIGQEIHDRGGLAAMQAIVHSVEALLEGYWELGILASVASSPKASLSPPPLVRFLY